MRTKLIAIMAAVCFTATCFAKDIKIVVLNTDPQMHCANCESKIKNNIRFEKGIKKLKQIWRIKRLLLSMMLIKPR